MFFNWVTYETTMIKYTIFGGWVIFTVGFDYSQDFDVRKSRVISLIQKFGERRHVDSW